MGGRNKNNGLNLKPEICKDATLREENLGKKEVDASLMAKMKHLHKLATWASGEGGVPPLAALFGYRLAATAEAHGVPLDHSSSVFCQRCESILLPGYNCRVRIETCTKKKQKNKKRKRPKATDIKNYIVYTCNFCHHRNAIKGSTVGQMRELSSSKKPSSSEPSAGSNPQFSLGETTADVNVGVDEELPISRSSSAKANDSTTGGDLSDQMTPLQNSEIVSKDNKNKESKMKAEKLQFSGNSAELCGSGGGGSGRRRRRAWSSLKDIVEGQDAESSQNAGKLVIPFFLGGV